MDILHHKNFHQDARTFCLVAENGSFSTTGKILNINQSTVSRRIIELEEILQVILIKRNTRTVKLTESGEKFYKLYKSQEEHYKQLFSSFADQANSSTTINLSVPMGVADNVMSHKIPEFLKSHPGVRINIIYQNRKIDFIKESIDIAILRHIPKQQTIKIKLIYNESFNLYATKNYIEKYGLPRDLSNDEINKHHVICAIDDDLQLFDMNAYDEQNNMHTINYIPTLAVNNVTNAIQIGMNGDFIFGGMDSLFGKELKTGGIVKILPQYTFSNLKLYLVRTKDDYNPVAEELYRFIEQCFV